MRSKQLSILAFVLAIAFTTFAFYYIRNAPVIGNVNSPVTSVIDVPDDDNSFGGLFAKPDVNDSMPYYLYKQKEDSLNSLLETKRVENESEGSGKSYGPLGTYVISQPVTGKSSEPTKTFYIGLTRFTLDNDAKFFVENGNYHLAYVTWEDQKKGDSVDRGHYESKQIPVRYAREAKRVLIPVEEKQYRILRTGLDVYYYALIFFLFYFFIGLPVQILLSISRGMAFNEKNTKRFKTMSYVMGAYALICMLAPHLLKLVFNKSIPADFKHQSLLETFSDNIGLVVLAVVLFIISKAFARGYKLQQDHDLMV